MLFWAIRRRAPTGPHIHSPLETSGLVAGQQGSDYVLGLALYHTGQWQDVADQLADLIEQLAWIGRPTQSANRCYCSGERVPFSQRQSEGVGDVVTALYLTATLGGGDQVLLHQAHYQWKKLYRRERPLVVQQVHPRGMLDCVKTPVTQPGADQRIVLLFHEAMIVI